MILTEQWKNGELEWDREYYVDLENNGIVKQLYLDKDGCFVDGIVDYSLKNKPYMEVLAPVPSYEEWMRTKDSLDDYKRLCGMRGKIIDKMDESNEDTVKHLRQENAQLRKFLEEFNALDVAKENQQLKTQIAKLTEIVGVLPSNHSVGNLGYKIKNQRHEINNRLKEIDKLKELLKECIDDFNNRQYICRDTLAKIDEVLK